MIWKNVLFPHYRKISRFVSPQEFHIEFIAFLCFIVVTSQCQNFIQTKPPIKGCFKNNNQLNFFWVLGLFFYLYLLLSLDVQNVHWCSMLCYTFLHESVSVWHVSTLTAWSQLSTGMNRDHPAPTTLERRGASRRHKPAAGTANTRMLISFFILLISWLLYLVLRDLGILRWDYHKKCLISRNNLARIKDSLRKTDPFRNRHHSDRLTYWFIGK